MGSVFRQLVAGFLFRGWPAAPPPDTYSMQQ